MGPVGQKWRVGVFPYIFPATPVYLSRFFLSVINSGFYFSKQGQSRFQKKSGSDNKKKGVNPRKNRTKNTLPTTITASTKRARTQLKRRCDPTPECHTNDETKMKTTNQEISRLLYKPYYFPLTLLPELSRILVLWSVWETIWVGHSLILYYLYAKSCL